MATMTPAESLATRLPCLERAPGVLPWDPERLALWGLAIVPSPATLPAVHAVRAVVAMTGPDVSFEVADAIGRFDPVAAARVWDDTHRDAYAAVISGLMTKRSIAMRNELRRVVGS